MLIVLLRLALLFSAHCQLLFGYVYLTSKALIVFSEIGEVVPDDPVALTSHLLQTWKIYKIDLAARVSNEIQALKLARDHGHC